MIKTELNCQASGKTNPAPLQISHLGKNIIRMGLSQGLEWEGKVRENGGSPPLRHIGMYAYIFVN